MDNTQSEHSSQVAAAQKIWHCWQSHECFDQFEDALRPVGLKEAYLIQQQLEIVVNESVVGWKIAGTAAAGRQHINVDTPLAGRLFASRVYADGGQVSVEGNRMAVAEAEIVLCLGTSLPARTQSYSHAEVAAAVQGVRVGLELPDSRFTDFTAVGAACLIADNACAREFILGPEIPAQSDIAATAQITTEVYVNDDRRTEGIGADALGGPLEALLWLVNTLNEQGLGLAAGQYVTTGVTGRPVPVVAGDQVRVVAGGDTEVRVSLI